MTELLYLPGSPWSSPLMWSLHYGKSIPNDRVKVTKGGGPFTYWYISWKLGEIWPEVPLTLPMLIETGKPTLTNSADIAARLCSTDQFPMEHQASIREWHAKVNKVQRFARGKFLKGGNDNVIEKLIGKIPVITNFLHGRMISSMREKYMKEDCAIEEEEVKQIYQEMAKVVRHRDFFLGGSGPTYVDFCVATAVHCIEIEGKGVLITELATNTNTELYDQIIEPIKNDLKPLFEWKEKLYSRYYFSEEMNHMRKDLSFLN